MNRTLIIVRRVVADAFGLGLLGITEDTSMMEQRLRWLDRRPWRRRRMKATVATLVVAAMCATVLPMSRPRPVVAATPAPPTPHVVPAPTAKAEPVVVAATTATDTTFTNSAVAQVAREDTTTYPFWMVDPKPELLEPPVPIYPPGAREAGFEGDVFVEIIVDVRGNVERARVLRGPPIFHDAAIAAAMKYRFTPAIKGGVPVRVKVANRMSFRLNAEKPDTSRTTTTVIEPRPTPRLIVINRDGTITYYGRGYAPDVTVPLDRLGEIGPLLKQDGATEVTVIAHLQEVRDRVVASLRASGLTVMVMDVLPRPGEGSNLANIVVVTADGRIHLLREGSSWRTVTLDELRVDLRQMRDDSITRIQVGGWNEYATDDRDTGSQYRSVIDAVRAAGLDVFTP